MTGRPLSILLSFFFSCLFFYESQALHRQLCSGICYFLVTLLVLHMPLFGVFASNYALFGGVKLQNMLSTGNYAALWSFPAFTAVRVCVCAFSSHSFWTSSSLDVPAWVTQEEGHTGFLIHLSAVRALIFLARRIHPFLSLVDREVEFCVCCCCFSHINCSATNPAVVTR